MSVLPWERPGHRANPLAMPPEASAVEDFRAHFYGRTPPTAPNPMVQTISITGRLLLESVMTTYDKEWWPLFFQFDGTDASAECEAQTVELHWEAERELGPLLKAQFSAATARAALKSAFEAWAVQAAAPENVNMATALARATDAAGASLPPAFPPRTCRSPATAVRPHERRRRPARARPAPPAWCCRSPLPPRKMGLEGATR